MRSWRHLQMKEHQHVTLSLWLRTPHLSVTSAGTPIFLLLGPAPFQTS